MGCNLNNFFPFLSFVNKLLNQQLFFIILLLTAIQWRVFKLCLVCCSKTAAFEPSCGFSFVVVEHLNSCHESPDADAIILGAANFFGLVINGVEFADFVAVTDLFKESLNCCTVARALEVLLLDSDLSVSRREQQVNGLGFVSIVLEVSNRPLLFVRNVHSDCWATERTLPVLLPPQSISTVWFNRLTKISVRLQLAFIGLSSDALTSVPVKILLHFSVSIASFTHGLALTKVFDSS